MTSHRLVATVVSCVTRLVLTLVAMLASANVSHAQIAVRGDTVHTMAGPPILDGVVLLRDGRIERVGPASEVAIPAGYRTLTATVVTPWSHRRAHRRGAGRLPQSGRRPGHDRPDRADTA